MVKDNSKNSGLLGRYVWLVEVIGRNRKITFDAINKIWLESPLNPMKEPLPKKTFQNHCAKIKEIFGVDILCDRKADYRLLSGQYEGSQEWRLPPLAVRFHFSEQHDERISVST